MGTRALITRQIGDGFAGTYHHWDGYPTGLGHALWHLLHGKFKGDLGAMLKVLIDDHPAGWSTIVEANWQKKPGYAGAEFERGYRKLRGASSEERKAFRLSLRPQCYCHGERHEEAQLFTHEEHQDGDAEYAYVFAEEQRRLTIMVSRFSPFRWVKLFTCSLDDREPDWEAIEEAERENKQQLYAITHAAD